MSCKGTDGVLEATGYEVIQYPLCMLIKICVSLERIKGKVMSGIYRTVFVRIRLTLIRQIQAYKHTFAVYLSL